MKLSRKNTSFEKSGEKYLISEIESVTKINPTIFDRIAGYFGMAIAVIGVLSFMFGEFLLAVIFVVTGGLLGFKSNFGHVEYQVKMADQDNIES
ncbi:hypothetical protein BOW35_12700 [Solemya velum gill symbiont]|uniref:hypothetical protein n=1 Tax=Solemya velum gill symbiont TaxID=2340 RepID=UPI0009975319|nr:hypothetical protein [Solemya velum gill symbiont]OOZ12314.1 hypothetical protein BOW27_11655 [Solemya velum gill symbiont]OOZ16992.1 hypothetical protein BOW29_11685 [Solemya velum gill symbiont]OOZ20170.1 hypothetical protein BOW30_12520 [Solemya velum gill symbiont]OOZ21510.1 hypothetical protein BOW31_12625 [Solemya velum gill symbiont]OOZ26544.1 hypothetical protein BOW33_12665 [Solemya velum gill symbiont]